MDKLDRIGLLGGSFDPIHLGHINMGLRALEELQLDKVFYITAKNSPFKVGKSFLSAEKRHALVEKAVSDYDGLEASAIELESAEEISYSYQTIESFKTLYPKAKLFWLMGDDSYSHLESWKNYQWIIENIEFIVFTRNGHEVASLSSDRQIKPSLHIINDFNFPISSSDIKSGKLSYQASMPKNIVSDYIELR